MTNLSCDRCHKTHCVMLQAGAGSFKSETLSFDLCEACLTKLNDFLKPIVP